MKRDFLEQMRDGASMRYPVKLGTQTFWLRPLTVAERTSMMNILLQEISNLGPQKSTAYHEHTLVARETLKMASKESYDSTTPGVISDYILDRLIEGELLYLYKEYVRIMDRVNPALENLSLEEIKSFIEAIKKKDMEPIELSSVQLANICQYLIREQ